MIEKIKTLSTQYFEEILSIRKELHKHPELSFQEFKTSRFLKSKLRTWGIEVDKEWVETGFTVVIDSGKEGDTIALRADMDALPIQEQAAIDYKSVNEGVMHACGHDVHAACLMGVAKILHETKTDWKGKVVLVFQPGEEKLPGGASLMIKEGLLEHYSPSKIIAQHVYPEFEVGKVGFKPGTYMASADEIYLTVKGKGGHAALPHNNIDSVVVAANIICQLQQLSSRFAPATLPTVLSFGKIIGEGATNVIPSEVKIEGTLRTFNEGWRSKFHEQITTICEATAKASGAECDVDIQVGYPFLVNDAATTETNIKLAEAYLGSDNVERLDLRMTAEDFAYFSQTTPSCFYRLGVGNSEKGINKSVHHPEFSIDEKSIEIGVGLMAYIAINQLQ